MLIKIVVRVTCKRDGRVLHNGTAIGVVKRSVPGRYGDATPRKWECLTADGVSLIQQCDTQREGVLRLLILHGRL